MPENLLRWLHTSRDSLIAKAARALPDEEIAMTLNRQGQRTGTGLSWTAQRVAWTRNNHHLPAFELQDSEPTLTLEQSARHLGISPTAVRRLIHRGILAASQVVDCAPWKIRVRDLESEPVRAAVSAVKLLGRVQTRTIANQPDLFSET